MDTEYLDRFPSEDHKGVLGRSVEGFEGALCELGDRGDSWALKVSQSFSWQLIQVPLPIKRN